MSSLPALLFGLVLIRSSAIKIADMDQGAEFTKCIKITDYQTKTISDDITLVDRESTGCCPKDYTPGTKFYASYKSPQIVCGFKTDGSVATSITTGTNMKCEYNKCYVDKQNLACADGSKQLLNGCCAKTTKANTGFPATCKNYFYTVTSPNKDKVNYCTTYHKDYSTLGWAGTSSKADDQKDGKLQQDKIYTYTPCAGGGGSSGGSSTGDTTSGVDRAVVGVMGSFAVAIAQTMWL